MSLEQHIGFASEFVNQQNIKLTDEKLNDIIAYMKDAPPQAVEIIWRKTNIDVWMNISKTWSGMTDIVVDYYKEK